MVGTAGCEATVVKLGNIAKTEPASPGRQFTKSVICDRLTSNYGVLTNNVDTFSLVGGREPPINTLKSPDPRYARDLRTGGARDGSSGIDGIYLLRCGYRTCILRSAEHFLEHST